jgi:uncharacterized RDD family membrane protein YckC
VTAATRVRRAGVDAGADEWQTVADVLLKPAPPLDPALAATDAPLAVVPLAYESPAKKLAEVRYAGFWDRFVAFLLDMLLLVGFMIVLNAAIETVTPNSSAADRLSFAALLLGCVYFAAFESSPWQGTPGKRLLRIKVVDLHLQPVGFARAFGRNIGRVLSSIFYIGYVIAAFTARKQALHDLMAGCLVVKRERE